MKKGCCIKFKVKDMDIATGGHLIAVLNYRDAEELDLHSEDRILLKFKNKEITCTLDISESDKAVPKGRIGLMEEVLDKLGVKHNGFIELKFTGKPESVKHIRDKLYGKRLNYRDLYHIVDDITNDRLTEIEKTYFVSAGFIEGWDTQEIVDSSSYNA